MRPELFELMPDVVLFVAVARAKNFSLAAKRLRMPVSTLSRRVAVFESKLGVQLLHRSTRRVELTDSGARYFERCQLVVEAAEAAQAELHGDRDLPRGPLRVSATPDFALAYLTPMFHAFASTYPDIAFDLDLTARSVDLIAEGIDVAIRMGPLPDSQLFARKLGDVSKALYASPAYVKRAGTPTTPADLGSHTCIRLRGPIDGKTAWSLVRGDRVETVEVGGRFVANSMRFNLELASMGHGIAMLDCAIARAVEEAASVVRVLPDWCPTPAAVHALTPSKLLLPRTRLFLDALGEHLRAVDHRSGRAVVKR